MTNDDPNDTLRRMRKLADKIDVDDVPLTNAVALAVLVHTMDQWLSTNGCLPDDWMSSIAPTIEGMSDG